MLREHRRNDVLRNVANDPVHRYSVLEKDQTRNARHLILPRNTWVIVRIKFYELRFTGVGGGDLFDDRPEHFARPAPGCPKIDEHGLAVLKNFGLKIVLRNVCQCAHVVCFNTSGSKNPRRTLKSCNAPETSVRIYEPEPPSDGTVPRRA